MSYRVVNEDELSQWDATASKYSQILQSFEWGEVKSGSGWEPIRIRLNDSEVISILKKQLPFINRSFFYVPRGPLINFDDQNSRISFVDAVTSEAKKHNALFLRMYPEIKEDETEKINVLKKSGFVKAKKEVQPRSTYILDLTRSLDELLAGFESKFRYNIKVAEKNGVEVREDNSENAVEEFYRIYQETRKRQTFIIHPISYYKKIFLEIINKKMGSIFIAYKGTQPIAGVFIFCFGNRAWYMYGASSNEFRNIMPNNLIHWNVIKWAKEKGFKEYDLWGIPSNPHEGHPLWGVYRFKKGFNAELVKFIGSYDYPFNKLLYKVFDNGIILYQNIVRFIKKGKFSDSLGE